MIQLTIPEIYRLTPVKKRLYDLITKYRIPVTGIRDIDITIDEIETIDKYLRGKVKSSNASQAWRVDSFWAFADKFTADRKKTNDRGNNLDRPYYDIMFDHYAASASWQDHLEDKRNQIADYLYKGFPRAIHQARVDTDQNRQYLEYMLNNRAVTGPSGRHVYDVFDDRVKHLITSGAFTDDLLFHLAVKDQMLLYHVMDLMYPPSYDKRNYPVARAAT